MDPIHALERMLGALLRATQRLSHRFGRSDSQLARESQKFWTDPENRDLARISHWRGHGPFEDDELWLRLGRRHRDLSEKALNWAKIPLPLDRIVEWGVGGGMNAVALLGATREYVGVDVSASSLTESSRQADLAGGAAAFVPVQIDAAEPEIALARIPGGCTFFLSTYVLELLPTAEYGLRILRIAYGLLRPGGAALVQIRYETGMATSAVSRRSYESTWHRRAVYSVPRFWTTCQAIGFEPLFVTLVPEEPELDEARYAYFALRKP
jgi:SAM-dependent methyltransferase